MKWLSRENISGERIYLKKQLSDWNSSDNSATQCSLVQSPALVPQTNGNSIRLEAFADGTVKGNLVIHRVEGICEYLISSYKAF